MLRAARLRRVSLLAAALAVACGTDTIDLLPVGAGGSTPSEAGTTSSAGTAGADSTSGGGGVAGSSGGSPAGGGGSPAGGGGSPAGGGGAFGCGVFGCGGFGSDNGFGGDGGECNNFEFCPCGPQGRCGIGTKCNARLGQCTKECDNPLECGGPSFLCEEHSCGICNANEQCEMYGIFGRSVCVNGRCEECEVTGNCPSEMPICHDRRCVQCRNDDDCPGRFCNEARGRCEK